MFDILPVTTDHMAACGPACLKMLLAYYGIEVPLDQLIDLDKERERIAKEKEKAAKKAKKAAKEEKE